MTNILSNGPCHSSRFGTLPVPDSSELCTAWFGSDRQAALRAIRVPQSPLDGDGAAWLHATPDAFPFFRPCVDSGPWCCRPQSLGIGGDANPCENPKQEHGPQFK